MRCAVNTCKNNSTVMLGNNLIEGHIPLCIYCCKLMKVHQEARDKMNYDRGIKDTKELNPEGDKNG